MLSRRHALAKRALRLLLSFSMLAAITLAAHALSVNSTTAGFAYLLVVLILASTWGFIEAAVASIMATLALNFLPAAGRDIYRLRISAKLGWCCSAFYCFADCQPAVDGGEAPGARGHRATAGCRAALYVQPRHTTDRQQRPVCHAAYLQAAGDIPAERGGFVRSADGRISSGGSG